MHRGGGILSLDCARVLGWAAADRDAVAAWPQVLELDGQVGPFDGVVHGSRVLGPAGLTVGAQLTAFEVWLEQGISIYRPQIITAEAPLIIGASDSKTNMEAQRRGVAMWGAYQLVAARHHIATHDVNQSSVRRYFTGIGRGKAPVVETCRRRGWEPRDHNAADALATLDYTIHDIRRRLK